MRADHTLRGVPSGAVRCRATARGWMTAIHGTAAGAGDDEAGAVLQRDAVAAGLAAKEVDADQVGHPRRARPRGHLGGCTRLHDAPLLDDDQALGERQCFERIVCDDELHTGKVSQPVAQRAARLGARAYVERGQRLVEQQQERFDGEGADQRHALRLTAGEARGPRRGVVGQPDARQPGARLRARRRARMAAAAQTEGDVVECAQVREQPVVLEHDADRPLLRGYEQAGGGVFERAPIERDAAARQRHEPGKRRQQRALAGPVRTEHGDDLAGADR